MSTTISSTKLAEMLAKVRAEKAQKAAQATQNTSTSNTETILDPNESKSESKYVTQDRYGNLISYNEDQKAFLDLAESGASGVLVGAAGTGKTTAMRGTIETLISSCDIPQLTGEHKHLLQGAPGIVIIAYTRRAISNIKKVLPEELKGNAITYHKLMEYEPQYFEIIDPETQEAKNTMQFVPCRNATNPLPTSIHTIIVEEASMLSVEYFQLLISALAHPVQFIFLGDIYQLPPVFGSAILGFKMIELKTIELKTVYRQALESPIIKFATDIRLGKTKKLTEKEVIQTERGILTLHPWAKKLHADNAIIVAAKFMIAALETNVYDPMEDMILIPFNKSFGTIELNARIATHLARKNDSEVFEIIAGFNKHYFRVGEKIMYDKEDATILEIKPNPTYAGMQYQQESKHLDYFGCLQENSEFAAHKIDESDVDSILDMMSSTKDEDRVHSASHKIKIKLVDSGAEFWVDKAADINAILLGYALTVHKAQGSEWSKVFFLCHQSNATMLSRELLYTAVTRARNELYVICEKETFVSGVKSQRIKGNTLAEKAEIFRGKLEERSK